MSKLNFVQAEAQARDVGGPPGWVLLLAADIVIVFFAVAMLIGVAR